MKVTRTLKLKFLALNQAKAELFEATTLEYTCLANELLQLSKEERRKLTTAKVSTTLKSALANQVIRLVKGKAGAKTKQYELLPPEINCQNWSIFKSGCTYSVCFPTLKGVKRVPITVHSKHWQILLDKLLKLEESKNWQQTPKQRVERGTLKLFQKKGKWYALISLTEEVPEVKEITRVGVDRGLNQLATAVPKQGFGKFFSGRESKHRWRLFQTRRKSLQKARKYRAVKKLEQKESRWMKAVNHTVSRRIVDLADRLEADLVLEDLRGCRQTMKQTKKSRADNAESRHCWAYYDLELKLEYKQALNGRRLHLRPPHYSSKTSSVNGIIGERKGHWFKCKSRAILNSDFNAGRNLAIWDYRSTPVDFQKALVVMASANLQEEVFGSPRGSSTPALAEELRYNSMNTVSGRVIQLELFDCTKYGARQENPRS
ncbi:transposase [Pleurocapsales cyanobacterium LEGE 06147]|nr:transposase [Pleurocapsales cyanobacterium LEGE 06147]